ncbi:hypothetical protein GTQ40_11135 [Flavobacteriaceae bacterium R38]|nr:hypothetical protein [Flavobacteriaceae bacterium R38]
MKIKYALVLIQFFFLNVMFSQQNNIEDENVTNSNLISFVNAFPNPSEDFIKINVDANFREVTLKAKTNELFKLPVDNKIVDITTLPKGIYTIRIDTVDRIYFSKLFKK